LLAEGAQNMIAETVGRRNSVGLPSSVDQFFTMD
jgi:hypothetical protein